jgi:hypothetical protein
MELDPAAIKTGHIVMAARARFLANPAAFRSPFRPVRNLAGGLNQTAAADF